MAWEFSDDREVANAQQMQYYLENQDTSDGGRWAEIPWLASALGRFVEQAKVLLDRGYSPEIVKGRIQRQLVPKVVEAIRSYNREDLEGRITNRTKDIAADLIWEAVVQPMVEDLYKKEGRELPAMRRSGRAGGNLGQLVDARVNAGIAASGLAKLPRRRGENPVVAAANRSLRTSGLLRRW